MERDIAFCCDFHVKGFITFMQIYTKILNCEINFRTFFANIYAQSNKDLRPPELRTLFMYIK